MRGGGGGVGPTAERVSEARARRVTYRANTLLGKWRRRETVKGQKMKCRLAMENEGSEPFGAALRLTAFGQN